ncbi:MAG: hypothetical protein PQJ28_02470, partial [Spirochaetales bacterium]|nr:hypothetical protein [Spirochaetales bacterium]
MTSIAAQETLPHTATVALEKDTKTNPPFKTPQIAPSPEDQATDKDQVEISEKGRELAKKATELAAQEDYYPDYLPDEMIMGEPEAVATDTTLETDGLQTVAESTTASGRKVNVSSYKSVNEDGTENSGYLLSISGHEGEENKRFIIHGNTIINEGEDGKLHVERYTDESNTSGNDIIITNAYEANINSGDGDDTVVVLNDLASVNINTGEGDDHIVASWIVSSKLDTGAGNDRIEATRIEHSKVETGSGDDTIQS